MDKEKHTAMTRYFLRPSLRILTIGLFLLALLFAGIALWIIISTTQYFDDDPLAVIGVDLALSLFALLVAGVSAELAFNTGLTLSSTGVQYRYLGMTGFTTWRNIKHLEYRHNRYGIKGWNFRLKKPLECQDKKSELIANLNGNHLRKKIPLWLFVHLPENEKELHNTTFYTELLRYAPQVFEKGRM